MADFDLVNRALVLLGESPDITSDFLTSPSGDLETAAAEIYAMQRDAEYARYPWRFTMKKARLDPTGLLELPTTAWTVTAPNGGTAGNATDNNTATEVETTSNAGTTDPFVVLHIDMGEAELVSKVKLTGIRCVTTGEWTDEMRVQYSTDDSAWSNYGDPGSTDGKFRISSTERTISIYDDEGGTTSARYWRVVKDGGTDLDSHIALDEIDIYVEADARPENEWRYAFDLPSDRIAGGAHAVFVTGDWPANPIQRFEIFGSQLYANYAEIWLDYQYDPGEAAWPAYYQQHMVYVLAWILALTVTEDDDKARIWRAVAFGNENEMMAGGYFAQAKGIDARGNVPGAIDTDLLIRARMGAGGGAGYWWDG